MVSDPDWESEFCTLTICIIFNKVEHNAKQAHATQVPGMMLVLS